MGFSVLHAFCRQQNCPDGAQPGAALIADDAGNLYGTTWTGGSTKCFDGCGIVFRLAPGGSYKVLYSFCSENSSCADGELPEAPLILDGSGNLYGTTALGGANDQGTVFRLAPDGTETVLYSFCSRTNCTDGSGPTAGLVMDPKGNLFGVTGSGGASCIPYGCGTVFKLRPEGKEKVLYSFCSQSSCADGSYPNGTVVMDRKGNLYGTTQNGGANFVNCDNYDYDFCGTVFKVSPAGTETVLYSFCADAGCPDGNGPLGGVVFDVNDNLYGTTASGGVLNSICPNDNGGSEGGCGVVFKVRAGGKETVLYHFCTLPNCADGAYPLAGVMLKSIKGVLTLYGTAEFGGAQGTNGAGVVFSLAGNKETVLHSFCSKANCADGEYPHSGVISEGGSLGGAALAGGKYGGGTIYKLDLSGGFVDSGKP